MKKFVFYLTFALALINISAFDVFAREYDEWELISVDTVASVTTEHFLYNNIYYNTSKDANGYTSIDFGYIKNLSSKKMPVSISVGLFDVEEKNIGVINYCSTMDKSSSYADLKLSASESKSFKIYIKPDKYNAEGTTLDDVSYISVLSDNEYCKVGGADNYAGLTVSQMKEGTNNQQIELDEESQKTQSIIKFLIIVLATVIVYMAYASFVSSLYMKMYNTWTAFAYVPLVNNYLLFKMAFGPLLAKAFIGVLIGGICLTFVRNSVLMYVGNALLGIAFIVDIIKLITKKYGLFYYDPKSLSVLEENARYTVSEHDRVRQSMLGISNEQVLDDDVDFNMSDNSDAGNESNTADDVLPPTEMVDFDVNSHLKEFSNVDGSDEYFSLGQEGMNNSDEDDDYSIPNEFNNNSNGNDLNLFNSLNDLNNFDSSNNNDSVDLFNSSNEINIPDNSSDDSEEGGSDLTRFFR